MNTKEMTLQEACTRSALPRNFRAVMPGTVPSCRQASSSCVSSSCRKSWTNTGRLPKPATWLPLPMP